MGFALRLCSRAMTAVLQPATLPMNDNDVTALAQVDVARALADAKGPASIPVGMQPSYADVTGTARPAQ